jgi:hypothetical protein
MRRRSEAAKCAVRVLMMINYCEHLRHRYCPVYLSLSSVAPQMMSFKNANILGLREDSSEVRHSGYS